MKAIIYIIIYCIPFLLFAQHKSSIDLVSGAGYAFRDFENPSYKKETGVTNYLFGVNYNQRIAAKIFLKTGLHLITAGYKRKFNSANLIFEEDLLPGSDVIKEFDKLLLKQQHFFLEIPLNARYEFAKKKFQPYVEAGVIPSLYLSTRYIQKVDDNRTTQSKKIEYFRTVNLVANVAFGLNYDLKNGNVLFFQPTIRYFLTESAKASINNRYPEHLYNFMLETGLRFNL